MTVSEAAANRVNRLAALAQSLLPGSGAAISNEVSR
jgi:hypothetical protein